MYYLLKHSCIPFYKFGMVPIPVSFFGLRWDRFKTAYDVIIGGGVVV